MSCVRADHTRGQSDLNKGALGYPTYYDDETNRLKRMNADAEDSSKGEDDC